MNGKVDPLEDTQIINFELALADIGQVTKKLDDKDSLELLFLCFTLSPL